jgi:hypothetical protein
MIRKTFPGAALASMLVMGIAAAAPAPGDPAAGPGVGKWRWNPAESHYTTGAYAKEQTMVITRNDPSGLAVSQTVTPIQGQTFNWEIEAPYDNKMRHASQWMSFAFKRISATKFHDRYKMDADGERGEETFTITPDRITIRGASMHKGKKAPYVEIWDRVE